MMTSPWKPWYCYRPSQIVRRIGRGMSRRPTGPVTTRLPWGCLIEVDPGETIGRAIWMTGVYDLAVTEMLFRLTKPGSLAVDAGANIGYMAGVMAVRAGREGRVVAFEPHPVVAEQLRANAKLAGSLAGSALIEVRQTALSSSVGTARLHLPETQAENNGLAFLGPGEGGVEVPTETLDAVVGDRRVGVMKLDVEGHEAAVLDGSHELLSTGRITHLVFEEHRGINSEVCRILIRHGYHLFQIGWRLRGPEIQPADRPAICRAYEAPSFLATVEPDAVRVAVRTRGWEVYR